MILSEEIVEQLLARLDDAGHRGGAFGSEVLLAVSRVLPKGDITSLETGCGKSTIMFSNLSKKHFVFAYDDRKMPDSSVGMVQRDKDFKSDAVTFVYGPTQKTLSSYEFPQGTHFDVILIDGPHGYPFPDLEYALLYPMLKNGGILIIDDVHIPSIGHMFDTLREDRMYDEVGVFATTGVLRRTSIEAVPADGDHWYEQAYNYARFPLSMEKYRVDRSFRLAQAIDFSNASNIRKHALRGIMHSSDKSCATTIDTSSAFAFILPEGLTGSVSVALEYRFVYADVAVDAAIVSGSTMHSLPPTAKRNVATFQFPVPSHAEMAITLLVPNALPEHDRGVRNYDFRRMGMDIFTMDILPSGSNRNVKSPASIKAMFSQLFGRSRGS